MEKNIINLCETLNGNSQQQFDFFDTEEQIKARANGALTSGSTDTELKNYFKALIQLAKAGEQYPVNLDDVWPLAYQRKDHAVRDLVKNFIEGVDYQSLLKNGERVGGGQNEKTYRLTTSCLEYLIARKERRVFDVYREFFHKTVGMIEDGQMAFKAPQTYAEALRQLAEKVEHEEQMKIEMSRQTQQIAAQVTKIAEDAPKVAYYDATLQATECYTFEQLAKELNFRSVHTFINALILKGLVYRQSKQLMLRAGYAGLGYTSTRTHTHYDKDGKPHTNTYTVWTEVGRQFLHYMQDNGKL